MTLQQKILAALAGSTSRTPLSTAQVQAAVGVKRATLTELEGLRDALNVGHCHVIKGGAVTDYWWLAGNVPGEDHGHSYRRKKKCAARLKLA